MQVCLVEIRNEGHDDGSDSRVKAAVVTRCLSPLGTGNDETGSDWLSGTDDGCSIEPLVAHCSPSLVEIVSCRTSTAISGEINIARQETVALFERA
jgi:hypothetical protein